MKLTRLMLIILNERAGVMNPASGGLGYRSFAVTRPQLWNSLPDAVLTLNWTNSNDVLV